MLGFAHTGQSFVNTDICTGWRLCNFKPPHSGKTLLNSSGSEALILNMDMALSMIHTDSGLHPLRFINFYFVCIMYVLLACVICVLHMFMVSQIQKRVSGPLGIIVKDSYGLACGC